MGHIESDITDDDTGTSAKGPYETIMEGAQILLVVGGLLALVIYGISLYFPLETTVKLVGVTWGGAIVIEVVYFN